MRKPRARERSITTILTGLAIAGVLAIGLRGVAHLPPGKNLFAGQPVRLSARGPESLDATFALNGYGSWVGRSCTFSDNDSITRRIYPLSCTLGTAHPRHHALVIGNSYAAAFVQGFIPLIRDQGYSVTLFSSWGASPTPSVRNNSPWSSANSAMWNRVYPELAKGLTRGDMVILTSDLSVLVPEPETAQAIEARQQFGQDLSRMSGQLHAKGIRLVVVHTLAVFQGEDCKVEFGMEQWFTPFGSTCNFPSRSHELKRREPVDQILRERQRRDEIAVVDFFDLFCPGKTCGYTRPEVGLMYRDEYTHPSVEMMPFVGSALVAQLNHSGVISK